MSQNINGLDVYYSNIDTAFKTGILYKLGIEILTLSFSVVDNLVFSVFLSDFEC